MKSSTYWLRFFRLLFIIQLATTGLHAQNSGEFVGEQNEITIYVIPSLSPIDWSNPSILFRSTEVCYLNAITRKNYYIIGHTIVRITSPMLASPYYIAMSGKKIMEKPELLLIKKIGLGALGATIQGHIESEKDIKKGLETYSKRNMVAYMKFRISNQAVRRVIEFVSGYQAKTMNGYAACDLYNGATWPRNENEGSGCSAFGMSVLDVAGVLPAESGQWCLSVKIPMNLIGGECNNNKKIKIGTILRTKSWYEGTGQEGVDFVTYRTYDPALIFNWIRKTQSQHDPNFITENENGISGLVVDKRNALIAADEPVFLHRADTNLFVKNYYRKIKELVRNNH
ncbi:MAG: hypothetical protein PHR83_13355 [Paludibacter sp.]|nr:hypothetical protein [Paludibacter sp.]